MLQLAPRVWLCAEWQISKRMCARLQVWQTVGEWEQECFCAHMPMPILIPVCILPQRPLCVFITHCQAPCSTHLTLTHSWTHSLHSSSEGNFICIPAVTPRTHTHHMSAISHKPPTQKTHSLTPFHSLKNTHLIPLAPMLRTDWHTLCHRNMWK